MIAKAHRRFWDCLERLPAGVRSIATQKFALWKENPFHPSLHFKELAEGLWSVRVSHGYRALARRSGDLVVWFWIGNHDDYEKLISR